MAGTAGTAATYTVTGSNLTPANGNITLALTGGPGFEYRNATAAGTFGTGNVVIAYTPEARLLLSPSKFALLLQQPRVPKPEASDIPVAAPPPSTFHCQEQ